jgi:hypothetical protein
VAWISPAAIAAETLRSASQRDPWCNLRIMAPSALLQELGSDAVESSQFSPRCHLLQRPARGTRGNLLLCIIMHWMFNATPQVGKAMFPDVKAEGLSYKMVELGVLVVITVIAACVLRVPRGDKWRWAGAFDQMMDPTVSRRNIQDLASRARGIAQLVTIPSRDRRTRLFT